MSKEKGFSPPKLTKALLGHLWERTKGEAWEPPQPQNPLILALIEGGFVRRVDGCCGFERFKDSMVTWTEAGRQALQSHEAGNE